MTEPIPISIICGSLGSVSANRSALEVAVRSLTDSSVGVVEWAPSIDSLAMFRPELADDPPPEVVAFQRAVERSAGVVIAAPEYAGGLAGGTKNALDWLVGSASLYHLPVAVISAGTTGGEFAIAQLVRTLSWQGAMVIGTLGISAPKTKMDDHGHFTDETTLDSIDTLVSELVDGVRADPVDRLRRVSETIVPFGIDPQRFGDLT